MARPDVSVMRRKSLISATIAEIGEAGTLDVTVSQIAHRAGMSSALAHHYFGSKEQIFLAAMRHILNRFGESVRRELSDKTTPVGRIQGIIDASFAPEQFEKDIVAAWLIFYVRALQSEQTSRLLHIYARRLHSNLKFNLKRMFDEDEAQSIAQGLAALIDGFYIRHALQEFAPPREEVRALVSQYLEMCIERRSKRD